MSRGLTAPYFLPSAPRRRYTLGRAAENIGEIVQFSLGIHLPCLFSAILIHSNHLLTSNRCQGIHAGKTQAGISPPSSLHSLREMKIA